MCVCVCCCSVESLSVVDLAPGGCHSQVVSLAGGEHSGKVSSLSLTVALDHDQQDPLAPLGRLQASIAQTQLVVQIPFVLRVAVSHTVAMYAVLYACITAPTYYYTWQ